MITALLVDDDTAFAEYFTSQLYKLSAERKLDIKLDYMTDPLEVYKLERTYMVYFIDIILKGMFGHELAYHLRKRHRGSEFVFVSEHEQYTRESMKARPFAFMRKKHLEDDLKEVLLEIEKTFQNERFEMGFKNNSSDITINIAAVVYIQSKGHYIYFYSYDGEYIVIRNQMKVIESMLKDHQFVRVSRSYIINLKYLNESNNKQVIMKNGNAIPIISKYREQAVSIIQDWLEKEIPQNGI